MASRTYTVAGMSCGHCVAAVTTALTALPGVAAVDVDLAGGTVTVDGDAVDDGAVQAAVEDAGYEVRL